MGRTFPHHMQESLRDLLSKRKRTSIGGKQLKHSAVLIPLFTKKGAYHLVFIRRGQEVEDHRGEISFPGGLCEKGDGGPDETALREAFEEIGIHPHDVEVLGILDDIKTVSTRYRVTPVVGVIPFPYPFTINTAEVDELVSIPLAHLLDEENGGEASITRDGVTYTGYVYRYQDYVIWGATARILKNFFAVWTDLNRYRTGSFQS